MTAELEAILLKRLDLSGIGIILLNVKTDIMSLSRSSSNM